MKWVEALAIWNKTKSTGSWCIPKKGTKDYDEVVKIMQGTGNPMKMATPARKTLKPIK